METFQDNKKKRRQWQMRKPPIKTLPEVKETFQGNKKGTKRNDCMK